MRHTPSDYGRIESISIMRVMAMFMIILFHGLYFYADTHWILGGITIGIWDKVDTFLDIIDLPMFVFISGFLFGYLFCFKGRLLSYKLVFLTQITGGVELFPLGSSHTSATPIDLGIPLNCSITRGHRLLYELLQLQ